MRTKEIVISNEKGSQSDCTIGAGKTSGRADMEFKSPI